MLTQRRATTSSAYLHVAIYKLTYVQGQIFIKELSEVLILNFNDKLHFLRSLCLHEDIGEQKLIQYLLIYIVQQHVTLN